ncbi:hypothetical protein N9545_07445 [Salibacteraceae bacterium]|mgnify:FL=1|jgi:hypothetical protein|nr:hypothetical protein [Salibacteraceae bacterium]MDB9710345.1 hypothetical protein [Salibacteraceae bacterium]
MKLQISTLIIAFSLTLTQNINAQGACSTLLESIENASLDEASVEFKRLLSYKNPYCDTTGSDFEKLMKKVSIDLLEVKASTDQVLGSMGEPYYKGSLADYENQKVTIGRNGKPSGKSLPPSYKLPAGEYFAVYLWRKKDYLIFAFKGGNATATKWWQKGDY